MDQENKRRLLVIDDDADVLEVIGKNMEQRGYICDLISSPGFAAAKFEKSTYDAIITDLKMAIINGITIVRDVRATTANANTPIFVISGFFDKDSILKLKALNISGFIVKPFTFDDLAKKIEDAIANPAPANKTNPPSAA